MHRLAILLSTASTAACEPSAASPGFVMFQHVNARRERHIWFRWHIYTIIRVFRVCESAVVKRFELYHYTRVPELVHWVWSIDGLLKYGAWYGIRTRCFLLHKLSLLKSGKCGGLDEFFYGPTIAVSVGDVCCSSCFHNCDWWILQRNLLHLTIERDCELTHHSNCVLQHMLFNSRLHRVCVSQTGHDPSAALCTTDDV
jgi:hypothetical protein